MKIKQGFRIFIYFKEREFAEKVNFTIEISRLTVVINKSNHFGVVARLYPYINEKSAIS